MTRLAFMLGLLIVSAALTGCLPQELVLWSPDGQHATVLADGKLYLTDAAGKLTGPFAKDVAVAAWVDNKTVLAALKVPAKNWDEAAALMPKDVRRRVVQTVENFQADVLAGQSVETAGEAITDTLQGQQVMAAILYLRNTMPRAAGQTRRHLAGHSESGVDVRRP